MLSWVPFVASAALVSVAVHMALENMWAGLLMVALAAALMLPQVVARRRLRKLLVSGDLDAVLAAWHGALDRVPHPETMGPLILATALAAHGMTERARRALERARKGDAWEAALEHRLVIETLLDAFEGERSRAVKKAAQLAELPLPPAGPFVRDRVTLLRAAVGALARAFARQTEPGDTRVLHQAARRNPLVHWAMRYAAAVAHIERGEYEKAQRLLDNAPNWPSESAFADFHRELRECIATPGQA